MPLYASAFFLPTSQSVPYLLEDVYLRGGFRTVATIEARNAIRIPARKQGMMVFVQEDKTLYHIPGSTGGAAAWEKWDATKYVNFQYDAPLSLEENEETGERTLTIDQQRIVPVISEEEADYILIATAAGPVWAKKLFIPDANEASAGDAVVLGPDGKIVWGRSSGLPNSEGAEAGDTVMLDENGVPVWGRSFSLPSSEGHEEGTALVLDTNGQPIWAKVSGLPETDGHGEGTALVLDTNGQPIWAKVSELPETEGAQANNVLALDDQLQPIWTKVSELPSSDGHEEGTALILDNNGQPVWAKVSELPVTEGSQANNVLALNDQLQPIWTKVSELPETEGAQVNNVLALDDQLQPIWGKVSGLPETEGSQANNVLALNDQLQPVWNHLEGIPSYGEAAAGSVLSLNAEKQPDWLTQDKLRSARVTEDIELGVIGLEESVRIPVPITCATATLLRVALSHPMLLLEIHASPNYSDSNPYAFRSSVALLEDDGTTVLEDATVGRSRRYAIFSCPDVNDKTMYVKVTNEGPTTSVPTLSLTYLPSEQ